MDALINSLSDLVGQVQIGTELSRTDTAAVNNRYSAITLNRSLLTAMYTEHGIVQALIDLPVDDAFRTGVDIYCNELSTEDLADLTTYIEENQILQAFTKALKWARLFGGAGLIINAGQKMDEDFKIESIRRNTPLEFYPVDRWELSYSPRTNIVDQFSEPTTDVPYNYYGHRLHRTNVIRVDGKEAPSLIRGQMAGWGMSELERLVRSYNQFLKHQVVVFELLDEAKIDVFKIQGFNAALATPQGTEATAKRLQLASRLKNFQAGLALDKEDEYEQKQIAFGGLSEILVEIRKSLAADCRMPISKLFGEPAQGLASDDGIENYNAMVETEVRAKCHYGLHRIVHICCQKLFEFSPKSLRFSFKPLRMLTHEQENNVKSAKLQRILTLQQAGLITSQKAIEMLNAERIFPQPLDPAEGMDLDELSQIRSLSQVPGATMIMR